LQDMLPVHSTTHSKPGGQRTPPAHSIDSSQRMVQMPASQRLH
jgi:hypothetical protein